MLDVRKIILRELVVLLQVAEPLFGGGDVVALVLGDVLFAGRLQLLQVLVRDVLREVAEQRAVLRHGLSRSQMSPLESGRREGERQLWICFVGPGRGHATVRSGSWVLRLASPFLVCPEMRRVRAVCHDVSEPSA